jgi:DNA-binding transcriptional regulator/RsmH inhibitor MraZ
VDEKGRLKLPADFQQYLTTLGQTKVFITSFDERIARIYTIPDWKQVESLLRDAGEDSEGAEDLWFTAQDLGADAEMDNQGRLLMPPTLRRAMNVENQPIFLEHYKGHINVFGKEIYEERKQRAAQNRAGALKAFERRGLI